jgi:hypothetical protein
MGISLQQTCIPRLSPESENFARLACKELLPGGIFEDEFLLPCKIFHVTSELILQGLLCLLNLESFLLDELNKILKRRNGGNC